ncbi:MAG TPA: NAD(P)/FAD-dependent oxidoreductase [Vicinamibacterales bacterium]|nr:NAD(P)/FAD-dependent oxidoreductase [Vicinamibacterales bacterium]
MSPSSSPLDALVVGSGPNGLAAAIAIAREGFRVRVCERAETIGGGTRSAALTLPGFVHDVCSAVHALVPASPFFRTLPLTDHGLTLLQPPIAFAHPFDDGTAVACRQSIAETASNLDSPDAGRYRRMFEPLVERADPLMEALLGPIGRSHPFLMARVGPRAIRSAKSLAESTFLGRRARALMAGAAAHSMVPIDSAGTAGFALALVVTAHATGWPVARGGSQRLAEALAAYLASLGGEIETRREVTGLDDLPAHRTLLCDVTPRQLLRIAGDRLTGRYRRALERFRYGPGVFKVDWALHEPVPWRAPECRGAGTVHVAGTLEEVDASERAAWNGEIHERPFVLLVQPTVADPSRAPEGCHTLWAYCHVPNGSTVDMTARIEAQIERFAPGFRDCIAARHVMNTADLERSNPNLVGGDIAGGAADLRQLIARPVLSLTPYATSIDGLYLCSSSTPPGVGVHGMCGYHAAQAALGILRKKS